MTDKRIRFLGYQPQDVKGDLNNLNPELLPFALSYAMLEGEEADFSISKLLQAFKKLDDEQNSNYSSQEVRAFWQMFECIGDKDQYKK